MTPNNVNYSSGKIVALWHVIFLVHQYKERGVVVKEIVRIVGGSGHFGGTIPVKESISIGQKNGFFEINSGVLFLSEYTQRELLPLCNDETPNIDVLRHIIFQILFRNRFYWLIYLQEDVSIFELSIPQYWVDILNSADLLNFTDDIVIDWWRVLVNLFHNFDEEIRKEVGEIGEFHTMQYEESRISSDGINNSHLYLKWVSKISDNIGFDMLSIRGSLLKHEHNLKDPIQIEVKSSVISNIQRFRFKVTRNEWEKAVSNSQSYYFYCWAGINLNDQSYSAGPFIIPAKSILSLFPSDNHDTCTWTECKLILNLRDYNINNSLI